MLWEVPASALLMLLRQPGPGRGKRGFGTAEKEFSERFEFPEGF